MGSNHDVSCPITKGPRRLPLQETIRTDANSPVSQVSSEEVMNLEEELENEENSCSGSANNLVRLVHRWHDKYSILSVSTFPTRNLLCCGTQNSEILIFDLTTFERKAVLKGHTGSVLCLCKSKDEKYLFSGGSDSLVKVWDLTTFKETHTVYSLLDIGDIFSISWNDSLQILYFGCQNAAILYVKFLDEELLQGDPNSLPSKRFDKFFDSKGPTGVINKRANSNMSNYNFNNNITLIEVPQQNIYRYAHNGFIYSMMVSNQGNLLISGGGDGLVKIWQVSCDGDITPVRSLDNEDSVMSLAQDDSFLYCGLTQGQLKLWDLSTFQQIRNFNAANNESDIMTISISNSFVYKSSNGSISKCKLGNDYLESWQAHDGLVLCSEIYKLNGKSYLVTGGNDSSVAVWDVTPSDECCINSSGIEKKCVVPSIDNDSLLMALGDLVSFKTVSKDPQNYIDESRRCAIYLKSLFKKFGADTELLPVVDGNPIVYACFHGKNSESKSRILWYGHYDVIEADDLSGWNTNPFEMTANDGYLFGRGVSDNKGPILSSIFAVVELLEKGLLDSDIVFLIEGEEECGSFGFQKAIKQYKSLIGEIDWILLSNSYWLDEDTPCINYGLRGVLSFSVSVCSDGPDRHSGVDGGVSREPTIDLINLLSKLTNDEGKVLLPNFYEPIKPLTGEEELMYKDITERTTKPLDLKTLLSKWKYPSLTVHKIDVSGPGNTTVIPKEATASVSIRVVPEQSMEDVKTELLAYLTNAFSQFGSTNHLDISIIHEAEAWLGDPNNAAFKILHQAILHTWNKEPLYIREGGSIPSIRFLEKIFGAEAAQIPCGQSSDNAHLDNEKLRVTNLYALREILKETFCKLRK